jgi:nitrogen fixation/metabolism regulation signal transduction histidine kinase
LSLVLSALLPALIAFYFTRDLIERSMGMGLNPDVERALDVIKSFPAWLKAERHRILGAWLTGVLEDPGARDALLAGDAAALRARMQKLLDPVRIVHFSAELRESGGDAGERPEGGWSEPPADAQGEAERRSRMEWKLPLEEGRLLDVRVVLEEADERPLEVAGAWASMRAYAHARTAMARITQQMTRFYAVLLGVALLLALLVGTLISHSLVERLDRLVAATERLAEGDLDFEIPEGPRDELGRLIAAFNRMTRQLRDSQARIRSLERMAAWKEVARKLAHEIKNPLTPIKLISQELRAKYRGEDEQYARLLESSIEIIEEEVDGLRRLVEAFSTVGKALEPRFERVALGPFWEDLARSLTAGDPLLTVEARNLEPGMMLHADRMLLKRALLNLIENAHQASPEGAEVVLRATGDRAGERVILEVADQGRGIDPRIIDHIFEPYFTTRDEGTGLGLAIVQRIVSSHGGAIRVRSEPGKGAVFTMELPCEIEESDETSERVDRG